MRQKMVITEQNVLPERRGATKKFTWECWMDPINTVRRMRDAASDDLKFAAIRLDGEAIQYFSDSATDEMKWAAIRAIP